LPHLLVNAIDFISASTTTEEYTIPFWGLKKAISSSVFEARTRFIKKLVS
jgi:hypothetical protein